MWSISVLRDATHTHYQLYEARGGDQGREWEDWFQAERELRQPGPHNVVDRILATEEPYAAA
jgi:hypothetical protein